MGRPNNSQTKGVFSMDYETMGMLDEELKSRINEMKEYKPGSEEYTAAVEGITKLYKLKIEESKNELEYEHEAEKLDSENKHRKIGYVLSGVGFGMTMLFNTVWMVKGFKFEEDGVLCSSTFKWLTNGFRHKGK